ncbi:olfactory receptor 14C36-like, partial [Cygnus atratus]|uniref:olfactory receptor 14C36-like n=1 Tax=Cygnus atratus TaxID=8868 RepID=UPI0015D57A40
LHYGSLVGSRACAQMAAAAWGSGFLNAVLHTATPFSLPLCQGNAVDQFFCEIPQILKLSCSDAYFREACVLVFSVSLVFGCFVFIVLSYVQIFRAVLRMPSSQGRHKAFSTCLRHLAIVSLFISTIMVAYLKPPSISSPSLDLVVSFLYLVVPPAIFRAVLKYPSEQGRHKAFSTCLLHLAMVSLFVSTIVCACLNPSSISSLYLDFVVSFLYLVVPPAVNPLVYSMRNQELKHALKKLFQLSSRSN